MSDIFPIHNAPVWIEANIEHDDDTPIRAYDVQVFLSGRPGEWEGEIVSVCHPLSARPVDAIPPEDWEWLERWFARRGLDKAIAAFYGAREG